MQNFYEHQEVAKSNSSTLILMMSGAIIGTVLVSGVIITAFLFGPWYYFYRYGSHSLYERHDVRHTVRAIFREDAREFPLGLALFWYATLTTATGAAVVAVTYGKVKSLRKGGGASVAEALGGVRLGESEAEYDPFRGDPDCIRALNVVAEMAIAARLPTPQVFMLAGQDGINAFAVGYSTDDAVLGLTEGTVRKLTREQLQGVIAHEFAHIFNGDMRLNLQMIGYLHGLLGITLAATWIMYVGSELMQGGGRRNDMWLGVLLFVMGALLWPVGLIGNLFASLIKAAFSRQREYLADAYAVEFTRNAEGVAGALKRIAGHTGGSLVRHSRAVECSHLFFANGNRAFLNLFRSHPPIDKRILRVDPHWDGRPLFDEEKDLGAVVGVFEGTMNFISHTAERSNSPTVPDHETVDRYLETFDVADQAATDHVLGVQAAIPPVLWELSHESPGAVVQLFALWFSAAEPNDVDNERIAKLGAAMREPVTALVEVLRDLDAAKRLLLLDTATQTVGRLDARAYHSFVDDCQRMGLAGDTDNVFRWAWHHMVQQVVRTRADDQAKPRYGSIEPVLGPCEVMLSALAYAGGKGPMANFGLQRAISKLGQELTLRDEDDCTLETLDLALECLAELSARCRRDVLLACGSVVSCDHDVAENEAYLLRGIFNALGYPHARLLPGQPVAPGS